MNEYEKARAAEIYESIAALQKRVCTGCGASGCKLWEEYPIPRINTLKCAPCAAKESNKDISTLDEKGTRLSNRTPKHRTNDIGWYVPHFDRYNEPLEYYIVLCAWEALPSLPVEPKNVVAGTAV